MTIMSPFSSLGNSTSCAKKSPLRGKEKKFREMKCYVFTFKMCNEILLENKAVRPSRIWFSHPIVWAKPCFHPRLKFCASKGVEDKLPSQIDWYQSEANISAAQSQATSVWCSWFLTRIFQPFQIKIRQSPFLSINFLFFYYVYILLLIRHFRFQQFDWIAIEMGAFW